ncbi:MAG TPA: DUF3854 domain-containing protein, partial [Gemmataceae bacterium]|nr:DUF3854 domain-containing protein [Gemmataceae bacterium]
MANGSWRNATISSPCPICGKPDWCSVSVDGNLAACRRLKEGGQVKADANGSPYYLHWLSGTRSPASPPPPPQSECLSERADIDTLHAVYSALLARLQLSAAHNNNLHIRGLRDPEIDQLGYRTLTGPGRSRLAQELLDKFGDVVFQVPGFTIRERNGTRYVTLAGARGLLIPVRDIRGRIAALKIRRDESDGQRYSFLSSKRYGGPGPGAPVHVPLGVPSPASIVRLTEGDLKADIAFRRTGVPTISIPGVSSWRAGIEALKGLNAKVVRLAFDKDARNKAPVARMLAATAERLAAEGFTVEFERWPEEYKGIDDALAADAFVEILSGDSAQRAIAEIVAEGTSGESPQVEAKHRLADVLTKGQETLFRDREVLAYLAALAEEDPAEFACRRAQARTAGIRLRDLDTVIAPLRREIRSQKPPAVCGGAYRISAGRIVYLKPTMQGVVEVPLSNFWACISDTVILDDGVSKSAAFGIEGGLVDGRPLPRVTVNASEFPRMDWLTSAWQGRAVVFAGQGARDHLRCAIELLSTERIERTEFLHTGWREIGGAWAYLHAGGAIGSDGPIETVTVTLPSSLAGFQLPAPPIERKLTEAVRASLRLLDLAPPRIMFPLLASAYRAVLGACDFSIHVSGPSGVFKTETTALIQQHFGRGLDARHLPGSWSSTANALEVQAFLAKDA